jgi:hypothetical protein
MRDLRPFLDEIEIVLSILENGGANHQAARVSARRLLGQAFADFVNANEAEIEAITECDEAA